MTTATPSSTRALQRVGLATPFARDAAGAGVVVVIQLIALGSAQLSAASDAPPIWVAICGLLMVLASAAIAWRRRAPITALAVAAGAGALLQVVAWAGSAVPAGMTSPGVSGFAVLVCVYAVAAHAERDAAVRAIVTAMAIGLAAVAIGLPEVALPPGSDPDTASLAVSITFMIAVGLGAYVVPGLVGAYARSRRQLVAQLADRVAAAERERDARAAQAVAEERAHIARELHDVAAHHLSSIVVQAGAARRMIERDPDGAREAIGFIAAQGRDTLRSMRLVVGILRAGSGDQTAPQPTLSDLTRLLDGLRGEGADVRWEVTGDLAAPTAAAVSLTTYRIVQQALVNARTHAPGTRIDVDIDRDDDGLRVAVVNPLVADGPSGDGDGHGLVGMHERAALVGADLEVGAQADGTWLVRLHVPNRMPHTSPEPSRPGLGSSGRALIDSEERS